MARRKLAEQEGDPDRLLEDECGQIIASQCTPEAATDLSFGYYSKIESHFNWCKQDLDICYKLLNDILNYHDGMFNPLKRTIVASEKHFDIPIDKDWAKYKVVIDGVEVEKQVAIKGTIDLICEVDENIIEIVDWKTGATRRDFNTGLEKDYAALSRDKQLMLYYLAASKLYPNKHVMMTIFYVQAGGAFTMAFGEKDIVLMEEILHKYFKEMEKYSRPELTKSWKCSKICPYGDKGGYNEKGQTKCYEIQQYMLKHGMKETIRQHTHMGFDASIYQDGGGQSKEYRQGIKDESTKN